MTCAFLQPKQSMYYAFSVWGTSQTPTITATKTTSFKIVPPSTIFISQQRIPDCESPVASKDNKNPQPCPKAFKLDWNYNSENDESINKTVDHNHWCLGLYMNPHA